MFPSWSQNKTHLFHVGSIDSSRRISNSLIAELELLSKSIDDDHSDIRPRDIRLRRIYSWNPDITQIRQHPIESVPTELWIQIFELCEPNAKTGFALAHTCRCWMRIAAIIPSFWSNIVIGCNLRDPDLKSSFSFLTAQLNRAKGQLLDVFWKIDIGSPQHNLIFQFMRNNVPFHRWRSATIDCISSHYYSGHLDVASSNNVFTNLEKLTVKGLGGRQLLQLFFNIEHAPRLQSLDLSAANAGSWSRGLDDFTSLITRVSHLTLPIRESQYGGCNIPANITHLTATENSVHNYPHIRHYYVFKCQFESTKTIDLRSLTTFVVDYIELRYRCNVTLPVLRDMEFRELKLHREAILDAPRLKHLRVISNHDTVEYGYQSSFSRAMCHPGYSIWPSKTISVGAFLSIDDIIKLLTRHLSIKTAIFSFKEPLVVNQMLDFLAGLHRNEDGYTLTNIQAILGSLKEVGLRFECPISDAALWKECTLRLRSNQTKRGSLVSVWESWKGGPLPMMKSGNPVDGTRYSNSPGAQAVQLPSCRIKSLPMKVLLDIFDLCESKVQARLVLTHTCRHWMKIAVAVPYLWTSLVIDCRLTDQSFKGSLALLMTQLDRARGSLLDVYWIYHAQSPRNGILNRVLHDTVPFSRWRSLSVEVHGTDPLYPKGGWPHDAFKNLKVLTIKRGRIALPLSIIAHEAAPNLQMLDLADSQGPEYIPRLRHSSNIILPGYESAYELSPNITHLRVSSRSEHIFPHLLCYDLFDCKFDSTKSINLRNLSTFITDSIEVACHVTLPALRNIEFRILKLHEDASLKAPQLESLRVVPDLNPIDLGTRATFSSTMQHPGYNLWPTKTVYIGIHLSIEDIVTLLTRSRTIEAVSFSFREPLAAKLMLNMLAGWYPEPERYIIPNSQGMCSGLKEVRLNFGWRMCEVAFWKYHASPLVKNRLKKLPPVSVFGFWKGETLSVQLL